MRGYSYQTCGFCVKTKSSSTPQMQTRRCHVRLALYQWELAPSEVNIGSLHRSAVNETSTHRNPESVVRTKFGQHTVLAIVPDEEEQFPSSTGRRLSKWDRSLTVIHCQYVLFNRSQNITYHILRYRTEQKKENRIDVNRWNRTLTAREKIS